MGFGKKQKILFIAKIYACTRPQKTFQISQLRDFMYENPFLKIYGDVPTAIVISKILNGSKFFKTKKEKGNNYYIFKG